MRAKIYREHKYVSFVLNELERLIAKTDFTDDQALKHVKDKWHAAKEMLKGHALHEEQNVHPLLEKKNSIVHQEAHNDHGQLEDSLEHLQLLVDSIKKSPDRLEAGYQYYLTYRKFVADNLLHLHEEETKILPELQRLCTDEELRAIEYTTYNVMTIEEMIEMMQALFPHMNFSDKCAFIADIRLAQPKKFSNLWKKANQFLSKDEIQKISLLELSNANV